MRKIIGLIYIIGFIPIILYSKQVRRLITINEIFAMLDVNS